jgi:D-alanine transfer protein
MERADIGKGMPHLFAGLIACGLVAAVLLGAEIMAVRLEHATIRSTAPELFPLKNQGLAFQRAAARAPNVLPLYASSELNAVLVPERAHVFFRTAPTGFQISPVGAGGASCLTMSQKLAALGSDLRAKKIAISLSPPWFLTRDPGREGYNGNFSVMAAKEMVFGTALDFELKRDIALRMLNYPRTLEDSPFLEFVLKRLASDRWLDHLVFWALWPVGKSQTIILELQDHVAASSRIRHKIKPAAPFHPETLDWSKLIADVSGTKSATGADKVTKASSPNEGRTVGYRDEAFREDMNASPGWTDLELLLRTLAKVHARALLLSMPLAGDFYNEKGVSRSAREHYYAKLRALVQRYHFQLLEFEDHDEDPAFLYLQKSHLTAKGWIYYDRALDDFFHGRAPRS